MSEVLRMCEWILGRTFPLVVLRWVALSDLARLVYLCHLVASLCNIGLPILDLSRPRVQDKRVKQDTMYFKTAGRLRGSRVT